MPRIATVDGLVAKIFFNDHPPPHVHVYAGRLRRPGVQAARLSIDTGEVIAGKLPPAKVAAVKGWCEDHREALLEDWQRARLRLHPGRALRSIVMEPAIAPEMVAVIPRPAHTVRIVFADGEVRDVDITPLLDTPAFSPLREVSVFEQVKVDEDTGTIAWPGDVDLDPDLIYAAMNLGPNAAVIHVLAPSIAA